MDEKEFENFNSQKDNPSGIFGEYKKMFNGYNSNNGRPSQPRKPSSMKWRIVQFVLFIAFIIFWAIFAMVPLSPSFSLTLWAIIIAMFVRIFLGNTKKMLSVFIALLVVSWFLPIIASPIFNASEYQQLIGDVQTEEYTQEVPAAQIEQLPVVDEALAKNLADKKLGAETGLGSQYHVGQMNLISVDGQLVWVGPLEPNDMIKWFTTGKSIPGYIVVSATDPNNVQLVQEINGQPLDIQYTEGSYFFHKIQRHVYVNGAAAYGLTDFSFELDDEGNPYYVVTQYKKEINYFGGNDVSGIFVVDAQTGETTFYEPEAAPEWVDRVYPKEMVNQQLQYYGLYVNGYLNSVFAQKDVIQPTGEGAYLYYGDDCYFYVGMTSVAADNSTVGFMLVNTRTKETTFYPLSGATETAAMSSAEGVVQDLGYTATYPIIINLNGAPTYFMTLKDASGLVKQYAFVNVENYSIVGTGTTISAAQSTYLNNLYQQGGSLNDTGTEKVTQTVTIDRISSEINNGVTTYYFTTTNSETIYTVPANMSSELPLTISGDQVEVTYFESTSETINIDSFDNKNIGSD